MCVTAALQVPMQFCLVKRRRLVPSQVGVGLATLEITPARLPLLGTTTFGSLVTHGGRSGRRSAARAECDFDALTSLGVARRLLISVMAPV